MLVPDRRRRLLEHVRRDGSAQVEHLTAALGVSASTIRRDLAELEADGVLRRARGGAYVQQPTGWQQTAARHELGGLGDDDAKQRIGRAAAELVVDGMTVMILAGTTTGAMLPHLADRSITVVTNGLEVGHAVAGYPGVSLVMLGGVLHREQMTLLGPMTAQNMADLHVETIFAGAYGIDADVGVTGAKVIQAGYHHSMLRHTQSLVVLADSGKFGRRGPTLLARIDQVDTFVTDQHVDGFVADRIREQGCTVTAC